MNYKFQVVMLLFLPLTVISQSVLGGYNSTASGHSISIDYNINKQKIDFGVGLGVNLPTRHLGQGINEFYNKKLYPTKGHEYFALKSYFHRTFYEITNFKAFAFYDVQLRRSGARTQMYLGSGYDSTLIINRPEDGILYVENVFEYGPYYWWENTVGVGMDISIGDNFFIRQKFGIGATMIYGYDKGNFFVNLNGRTHIYGFLAYFGVGYRLNKKSP